MAVLENPIVTVLNHVWPLVRFLLCLMNGAFPGCHLVYKHNFYLRWLEMGLEAVLGVIHGRDDRKPWTWPPFPSRLFPKGPLLPRCRVWGLFVGGLTQRGIQAPPICPWMWTPRTPESEDTPLSPQRGARAGQEVQDDILGSRKKILKWLLTSKN